MAADQDTLRETLNLAGEWRFQPDPAGRGCEDGWPERGLPAEARSIRVPGVWNTVLPDYAGVAFYETSFQIPNAWLGQTVRVLVEGSNYLTEAWLNGTRLGRHEGGYTPFAFTCGDALRAGPNRLVLRIVDPPPEGVVDGLRLAEVPSSKESWYGGYGGLWGGVRLEASALVRVEDVFVRADPQDGRAEIRVELASARADPTVGTVRVSLFDPDGAPTGFASAPLVIGPDGAAADLPVVLARARLWSPEQPALYRWVVDVTTDAGDHNRAEGTFGLRSCALLGGRFLLNGRERLIKGVLLQPTYPRTLACPPDERMPARDVGLVRAAGFNLVRCHLRPPPPGFLDECDRAGLMAYVETPLAWIRPGPRLLEHGRRELRAMVRRDRNHPSVVLWGLFNENAEAARVVGAELLAEAARIDPTRPTIDNSGGAAVGEAGYPAWTGASHCWSPGAEAPTTLNDVHIYLASPLRMEARELLETAGADVLLDVTPGRERTESRVTSLAPGAVLVSEYGCGGLPDFEAALDVFGGERDLADARRLRAFRDDLAEGLQARGLDRELGGMAAIVEATQRIQAAGLAAQTAALRLNPNVSGYILTQLADAGWEQMAGIVGLWGNPRPAHAAMASVNRPCLLHVRSSQTAPRVGATVRLRTFLAQEPGFELPPQSAVLRLAVHAADRLGGFPGQPLWSTTVPVELPPCHSSPPGAAPTRGKHSGPWSRWTRLSETAVRIPEPPGPYAVRASLETGEGLVVETTRRLLTLAPDCRPGKQEQGEPIEEYGRGLAVAGRTLGDLLPGARGGREGALEAGVLLAQVAGGMTDPDPEALRDLAHAGVHVCVLEIDPFWVSRMASSFNLPLAARGARGNFMGSYHYLRRHPLFDGLPVPCLGDEWFAEVLPAWALDELPGAEVIAGCFWMPDGGPSFEWRATVQTVPYGRGRLTFYQPSVRPSRGTGPMHRHLWDNLIRWLVTTAPGRIA